MIGNPREDRAIARDNLIFYCRHARQSAEEVERLPVSEFQARRRSLNDLLEREFPDD